MFHATFKPFSREEVLSINNLISEFGDYHVEIEPVRQHKAPAA